MGSFKSTYNPGKIQEEIKQEIRQALEAAGIDGQITTDLWTYKDAPIGTLEIVHFLSEDEAREKGIFIPLYGYPQERSMVEDPFAPEWWAQWEKVYQKSLLGYQSDVLEAERAKRF